MTKRMMIALVLGLAALLASGPAAADDSSHPNKPTLMTPWGASFNVGGGVMLFTDDAMRDFASTGGSWDARAVFGTRSMFSIEAAYTGGAAAIDALGLDSSAALVSTGLEAAVRLNAVSDEDWQPYISAGAGWRRYDVTNADFNTSDIASSDNVFEIPMAAGVSYRYRGFIGDLRTTIRAAFDNDLMPSSTTDKADLHTWDVSLTGGWEF